MQEKNLDSFEALEAEILILRDLVQSHKKHKEQIMSRVLFRGQSDANWSLDTTLERYSRKECTVDKYNEILWAVSPAVSAFTGKEWVVEDYQQNIDFFNTPPSYDFMSYVRHLSFPSPLLDWTQSIYVALFFAYQNSFKCERVAVYAYVSSLSGSKSGFVGAPQIAELGPYVKTHQRHFSQQGQYTVSVKKIKNHWSYCSHEDFFSSSRGGGYQDLLYKFTLPTGLREDVLSKLDEMNINAFTLYGSHEGLMESLAYREMVLRDF